MVENEMKELKTTREVLQALLDGSEVEFKKQDGSWATLNLMYLNVTQMDKIRLREFRVKPTKPSIDWSRVHPDFKHLARDKCGSVFLYKEKPEVVNYSWSVGHMGYISASVFKSLNAGNCNWTESLVERPKE